MDVGWYEFKDNVVFLKALRMSLEHSLLRTWILGVTPFSRRRLWRRFQPAVIVADCRFGSGVVRIRLVS